MTVSDGINGPKSRSPLGSGGSSGYVGYEYQIDVAVWLMLHLVVAHRAALSVQIEPASQEDLEADIENDDVAGRLTSATKLESFTLVVQAKLRTGDAWTESKLRKLLKHGGEKRRSAARRLRADPRMRYLLVTSAGLNGRARRLEIGDPVGHWPEELPPSIEALGEGTMSGRVAVVGGLDQEKLANRVKELLTEGFWVPHTEWKTCREALRREVRARMRGGWGGTWARAEAERIVREHGGHLASSPELESFVAPTNWSVLERTLKRHHAVVIVGQSGTGKTSAAKKLVEGLREEISGLARVVITNGTRQLHGDDTNPPVVYEIEDPWGRVAFETASRDWNQQLPSFLEKRSKGAVYVVATTRADILASAGDARDRVRRWVVALEAEHYGDAERGAMYKAMAVDLPRRLEIPVARAKLEVLSKLATPLEIRKYFDALLIGDPEEPSSELIREAVAQAQKDAIERNVAEQIEQRREIRAAAVVWGLLKVSDAVPRAVVTVVEEALFDRYGDMERGAMPLVRFLVAGRSLRQSTDSDRVGYYHPRVEAGIQHALQVDENRLVSRQTLGRLAAVLASYGDRDDGWGISAAARLVAAMRKVEGLDADIDDATSAAIDEWLAAFSPGTERDFQGHLELAAGAGSGDIAIAEVGRYLVAWQDCTRLWGFIPETPPPKKDDAWFVRWRADPATRPLVERYVREVLTCDHTCDFERSFVDGVQRLAPGLSQAFLAAAKRVVAHGFYNPADVIATGAVQDLAGFEAVVDEAVAVVASSERSAEIDAARLAIVNGEYNADYAEHVAQDYDDGHTAEQFLRAYVSEVRRNGDWRVLADHRHRERLVGHWLWEMLQSPDVKPDPQEVEGVFFVGLGSAEEDRLWHVVERVWDGGFGRPLESRVYEGHVKPEARRAALGCLIERAPKRLLPMVHRLRDDGRLGRLVEIADDIAEWLDSSPRPNFLRHNDAAHIVSGSLPADMAALAEACLALRKGGPVSLPEEAVELLESVADPSQEVRRLRVSLDAHIAMSVDEDVRWLLAHAEDSTSAVEAVEAAIRRGLDEDVRLAMHHKYADVVAAVIRALGDSSAAPLPEELLSLAEAKGSPVRKALAEVLDAKPHIDHVPALVVLLRDEWSKFSGAYENDGNFPIARVAMSAIHKLASLDSAAMKEIHRIAVATSDRRIRVDGLRLLVKAANPQFRNYVLRLALRPGRPHVRIGAVDALCAEAASLDDELLGRITAKALIRQPAPIAAGLASLVGAAAAPDRVLELGEELAREANRRALALVLIFFVHTRSERVARQVADLLPAEHPGVAWALGAGGSNVPDEAELEDLGDAWVCKAVCECVEGSIGVSVAPGTQ